MPKLGPEIQLVIRPGNVVGWNRIWSWLLEPMPEQSAKKKPAVVAAGGTSPSDEVTDARSG